MIDIILIIVSVLVVVGVVAVLTTEIRNGEPKIPPIENNSTVQQVLDNDKHDEIKNIKELSSEDIKEETKNLNGL